MKQRILVVDDEPEAVELVEFNLKQAGYAVVTATDGAEALKKARAQTPDLIVLDVMLPEMDGFEICKTLRLEAATARVPIVMLTAKAAEIDRVLGLELGADDYLTKPFAFAELLVRVKALLRRGPVNRASVLRVGDLELDRLSQQVKRAGKRIELTAKEYSLLEYLVANAGRVFSRTMIIEHVWDQSFEGLTNIVDVYVRHLRAKVDDPFPTKLIHTVRGVGYSVDGGPEA